MLKLKVEAALQPMLVPGDHVNLEIDGKESRSFALRFVRASGRSLCSQCGRLINVSHPQFARY